MYILKKFQVGKRYLSALKNPIKTLLIWLVFSVTTLYGQGFWTPDCTFIFGREVWFYGDTLDGHVEVHFDSSEVQILDFAAWIDSVRQMSFSNTDMYYAQYVSGNPSWVTHGDSVVFAAGNGMQVSVTGPASQYDASVQYKADTSIVATKTFIANNYDLYDYWNLEINGVQKMQMGSAETIDFQAGDRVTITEPAQDDILFEVEDMYSVLVDSENVLEAFLDHDDLQGFVTNEHIDWTNDQGAINIHAGNYSNTQLSQENVEDYAGGMWTGNTETRAIVTYQDADGTIDITVDDMNDDVPEAGDFGAAGNLDANGYVDGTIANSTIWHGSSISAGYISLNDPLYNNSGSIDLHYNADFDLSGSDLNLAAGAVDEAELDCDNAPVDEYILSYESTTGNFEWQAMAGGFTSWDLKKDGTLLEAITDGEDVDLVGGDGIALDTPNPRKINIEVGGTIANSTIWHGSSISAGYISLNNPLYNNSGSIDLHYNAPIYDNSGNIALDYSTSDFDLGGGVELKIKSGAIDTNVIDKAEITAYIRDHQNYSDLKTWIGGMDFHCYSNAAWGFNGNFSTVELQMSYHSGIYTTIIIPAAASSLDKIELFYECRSAGDLYMRFTASELELDDYGYENSDGTSYGTYSNAADINDTRKITIPSTCYDALNITAGDVLGLYIERDDTNINDSYSGTLLVYGVLATFQR